MVCSRSGIKHDYRPKVQVAYSVRIQWITSHLWNNVIGDCCSNWSNPQSKYIMRKPPRHVSFCQTSKMEVLWQISHQKYDDQHKSCGCKKPVGRINTLSTALYYGHPYVNCQWNGYKCSY